MELVDLIFKLSPFAFEYITEIILSLITPLLESVALLFERVELVPHAPFHFLT
ncbi:MAG: hypothetical protein MK134_10475 [Dehalococcoidia bacterium]|jgi:hypothetical protein|nr:hypothetical protein [Dehalococcoidia bacterium]